MKSSDHKSDAKPSAFISKQLQPLCDLLCTAATFSIQIQVLQLRPFSQPQSLCPISDDEGREDQTVDTLQW